jgi:hypothetical protein
MPTGHTKQENSEPLNHRASLPDINTPAEGYLDADVNHGYVSHEPAGYRALCQSCLATKAWVRAKRLMNRSEVDQYLALSYDQVQSLIGTRQITAIRIKGEDRFDSRELDLLIETYKETAQRRA